MRHGEEGTRPLPAQVTSSGGPGGRSSAPSRHRNRLAGIDQRVGVQFTPCCPAIAGGRQTLPLPRSDVYSPWPRGRPTSSQSFSSTGSVTPLGLPCGASNGDGVADPHPDLRGDGRRAAAPGQPGVPRHPQPGPHAAGPADGGLRPAAGPVARTGGRGRVPAGPAGRGQRRGGPGHPDRRPARSTSTRPCPERPCHRPMLSAEARGRRHCSPRSSTRGPRPNGALTAVLRGLPASSPGSGARHRVKGLVGGPAAGNYWPGWAKCGPAGSVRWGRVVSGGTPLLAPELTRAASAGGVWASPAATVMRPWLSHCCPHSQPEKEGTQGPISSLLSSSTSSSGSSTAGRRRRNGKPRALGRRLWCRDTCRRHRPVDGPRLRGTRPAASWWPWPSAGARASAAAGAHPPGTPPTDPIP